MKGLARAREILKDRTKVATDLQREGKKIFGYVSVGVPLEIIAAFGLAPFRVYGDIREPITEADRGLPAAFCPYMRSVLDLALKGKLAFLDAFIMHHPCDAQEKTVRVVSSLVKFPFTHFIDMPATIHEPAIEYYRSQFENFQKDLELYTGKKLSEDGLRAAIELYNAQRRLVRELYDLKKSDPPLLTGRETLEVITALQTVPVEEGTRLVQEVLEEVKGRAQRPEAKEARLLVWGGVIHDPVYLEMIEASNAYVVIDDLDEGTRPFTADVATQGDLMRNLAHTYLVDLKLPRTFREAVPGEIQKQHATDLHARYDYLGQFVKDWKVDGVILQSPRYCDPHGFEVVDATDYFESLGVPVMYMEHSYSEGSLAPLRTRVEAFVETLR